MKTVLRQYIDSLNQYNSLLKTFCVDAVTFIIIFLLIFGFASVLNAKAMNITEGKSVDELKLELLSGQVEKSEAFLSSLKVFTYALIGGSILVFFLSILLFSYSRQYVWKVLHHGSTKIEWRWNGMTLLVLIFLIIFIVMYGLLRLILNSLLIFQTETAAALFSQSINAVAFLLFVLFAMLCYHSFAHTKKVWNAMGNMFQKVKDTWKKLSVAFVLIALMGVIISVILFYVQKSLLYQPRWVTSVISVGVLLLFLSWMRLFVMRIVGENVEI